MVWENGCTVIVMMTALVEDGEKQCDRYWPDEGSSLYHIYEVGACVCSLCVCGDSVILFRLCCVPPGEPGVRAHLV